MINYLALKRTCEEDNYFFEQISPADEFLVHLLDVVVKWT